MTFRASSLTLLSLLNFADGISPQVEQDGEVSTKTGESGSSEA